MRLNEQDVSVNLKCMAIINWNPLIFNLKILLGIQMCQIKEFNPIAHLQQNNLIIVEASSYLINSLREMLFYVAYMVAISWHCRQRRKIMVNI